MLTTPVIVQYAYTIIVQYTFYTQCHVTTVTVPKFVAQTSSRRSDVL